MIRINLLTGEVFDKFEPTTKCDVCGAIYEGYTKLWRHQEDAHPIFKDPSIDDADSTLANTHDFYSYMDSRLANEYRRHKSIYKF